MRLLRDKIQAPTDSLFGIRRPEAAPGKFIVNECPKSDVLSILPVFGTLILLWFFQTKCLPAEKLHQSTPNSRGLGDVIGARCPTPTPPEGSSECMPGRVIDSGGSVCESNAPTTPEVPPAGFEDREDHRTPCASGKIATRRRPTHLLRICIRFLPGEIQWKVVVVTGQWPRYKRPKIAVKRASRASSKSARDAT